MFFAPNGSRRWNEKPAVREGGDMRLFKYGSCVKNEENRIESFTTLSAQSAAACARDTVCFRVLINSLTQIK